MCFPQRRGPVIAAVTGGSPVRGTVTGTPR